MSKKGEFVFNTGWYSQQIYNFYLPSMQLMCPSHFSFVLIHAPFAHRNANRWQSIAAQYLTNSSDWSKQFDWPSHRSAISIQSPMNAPKRPNMCGTHLICFSCIRSEAMFFALSNSHHYHTEISLLHTTHVIYVCFWLDILMLPHPIHRHSQFDDCTRHGLAHTHHINIWMHTLDKSLQSSLMMFRRSLDDRYFIADL